ncbi:MAG TPA: hypothetical protein VG898_11140 [Solirubrobacterales bacterium]|nr:hypothetical protein [Solirubrobacterales bacterium]
MLAAPQALGKVGEGAGARVSEAFDSTGKAIAAVAGLGAFFFVAGYAVEWQRLKRGGLPPEQVLPLLPQAQIGAAGVRELAISVLFGGALLALLGFGLVALARMTKERSGPVSRRLNDALEHDVFVPTLVIGAITVLIVPFDTLGLFVAVAVTCLIGYALYLVRAFLADGDGAKFPLWRLTIAIAIVAVILAGARQHEFPEPRPKAIAELKKGGSFEATYLGTDAGKVMFRLHKPGESTELIVLHDDELESLRLMKSSYVFSVDASLIDRVLDPLLPGFQLSCIPPECRWDEEDRIGPSVFF